MGRLAALVLLALPAIAADKPDPAFAKWWSKFQAAVARADVKTIANAAQFPMDWENGPDVRQIRSASDLAANFLLFFTPEIRKMVATQKPERLPGGAYMIVWKARGNEYSMMFAPAGGTYALQSLGEGPP